MKRLFLIYGDPGSGKSTLARSLKDDHAFDMLSLDDLYVEFIKEQCPFLYFDALHKFIAPHYQCILHPRSYTTHHFSRDLANEWHDYLLTRIFKHIDGQGDLVVEGFLLYDCLYDIEVRMSKVANVFLVHVSEHTCRVLEKPLTPRELAKLGLSK